MRGLLLLLGLVLGGCIALAPGRVTERFTLRSERTGDEYFISLFEPPEADPAQPLPVIFLLDADMYFGAISSWYAEEVQSGRLPPALLVGVGAGSLTELTEDRARDYVLPPRDNPGANVEAFYGFLQQELLPELARRRPLTDSPAQRYLVGYSYGGLAAAYGLLRHSDFIARYGASSASVDYDDWHLFELEAATERADLPASLYVSVGTQEFGAPSASKALVERLRSRSWPSLNVTFALHEGWTHGGDGAVVALRDSLRVLLGEDEP